MINENIIKMTKKEYLEKVNTGKMSIKVNDIKAGCRRVGMSNKQIIDLFNEILSLKIEESKTKKQCQKKN